jgi:predicted metal-dependent phosphoesterase TrpH
LKVEFHCHTIYSKDSLMSPETLLKVCQKRGIDRIVITDHNQIEGALRAVDLDPQRVIPGEEIMTRDGELLAAFVTQRIPPDLAPEEAIDRLRAQGAFISVSHPFDRWRRGAWDRANLERIAPLVDAVEVFNARCLQQSWNDEAVQFALEFGLSGTAGSDAHTPAEIGRCGLELPAFTNAKELRTVLSQGKRFGKISGIWVHFFSTYAKWEKRRHPERVPTITIS